MAWTPQENVFDETPFVDNLLSFIAANAPAALAWASGTPEGQVPTFRKLYSNATGRLTTLFPAVVVISQVLDAPRPEGDLLIGQFGVTLQTAISGSQADELVLLTKTYGVALASMLNNIDAASLTEGTNLDVNEALCLGYRTTYDEIGRGGISASSWLQIFQTRVEYQLIAVARG